MAQVGIVMGSDSDLPVMAKAADLLEELGISYEMRIISAHREPDVFFEYAKTAEEKGFKVIIAGAGMAAHLPGMPVPYLFPCSFLLCSDCYLPISRTLYHTKNQSLMQLYSFKGLLSSPQPARTNLPSSIMGMTSSSCVTTLISPSSSKGIVISV